MKVNVYNTKTNKGGSFHSVLAFGLCVSDSPPLLSCVRYWVLVFDYSPQAVCSTCVQYQLNLKAKEHLLQMKIKDLRGTVRKLVLGVKGRKKR